MPGGPFANFNARNIARLRASDRKRLKEKVGDKFSISSETAELLVPAELLSARFEDRSRIPGVVYLTPKSVPLWFTLGENGDDFVPTVYTLWKCPNLLPIVSVPGGGAPAMLYGMLGASNPSVCDSPTPVVPEPATSEITFQPSTSLSAGQLVCITQGYRPALNGIPRVGPALAVGRMNLPGDLMEGDTKGQVLTLLHVWEDRGMGDNETPPVPRLLRGSLSRGGGADEKWGNTKFNTAAETFSKEQVTVTGVNGSWQARLHHVTIEDIETGKVKQEDAQDRDGISSDKQPIVRKGASSSIPVSCGNHTVTSGNKQPARGKQPAGGKKQGRGNQQGDGGQRSGNKQQGGGKQHGGGKQQGDVKRQSGGKQQQSGNKQQTGKAGNTKRQGGK